jgi:hypothetical protein
MPLSRVGRRPSRSTTDSDGDGRDQRAEHHRGLAADRVGEPPAGECATIEPTTTIVAAHSVCFVERSKSLVMNSSAPAIAPRS